jgi:hypothetical protein
LSESFFDSLEHDDTETDQAATDVKSLGGVTWFYRTLEEETSRKDGGDTGTGRRGENTPPVTVSPCLPVSYWVNAVDSVNATFKYDYHALTE